MRRKYSDRQRAQVIAVLGVNQGNLSATSRAVGIPIKTIADWRDGITDEPEQAELRNEEKGNLADKLEAIAHQCAGLLPGKLPDANVREIVGAMGQSIEKSLLLRGQSTDIDKLLARFVAKLQEDVPGVPESDLRAYVVESMQISEAIS